MTNRVYMCICNLITFMIFHGNDSLPVGLMLWDLAKTFCVSIFHFLAQKTCRKISSTSPVARCLFLPLRWWNGHIGHIGHISSSPNPVLKCVASVHWRLLLGRSPVWIQDDSASLHCHEIWNQPCHGQNRWFEKTRRRMARERRGAGSSLVSMETQY